jgi:hypothetical protein
MGVINMFSTMQTNAAIVLTYRDDFRDYLRERMNDTDFIQLLSDYQKAVTKNVVTIPNTLFNTLYTSLRLSKRNVIDVNWKRFYNVLLDDLILTVSSSKHLETKPEGGLDISNEKKVAIEEISQLSEESKNTNSIKKLSKLLTESTIISWVVYIHFMRIEKYGLPEKYIIEWLIKNIFILAQNTQNVDLCLPDMPYPFIEKTYDAFGILKDYELSYFHYLCEKYGIDYMKDMENDHFLDFKIAIKDTLEKNPFCHITISPNVAPTRFQDSQLRESIGDGIAEAFRDSQSQANFVTNDYETQIRYAKRYVNYYYNQNLSLNKIDEEIVDLVNKAYEFEPDEMGEKEIEIKKENRTIGLKNNNKRNIIEMLENSGFERRPESEEPENFNIKPGKKKKV